MHFQILSLVPSSSPQNVVASDITQTSAMVMFEAFPVIHENGILIAYEILFEPTPAVGQDVGGDVLQNVTVTEFSTIVEGLAENVLYNVTVRAYTAVGPGPFSNPVQIMTNETGKNVS